MLGPVFYLQDLYLRIRVFKIPEFLGIGIFFPLIPCSMYYLFVISGESGSEGSSDGSEENTNQQVCV